jgi:phosphoglycolate phosphatase-like HAD superfamily hydrolase
MQHLKGILFDIDGTLLDSNDAHAKAWVTALHEDGFSFTFDDVRPLIGKGGDHIFEEVIGIDPEGPRAKALSKRRGEVFKTDHLPRLQPFPGARALVEELRARGLLLAVATSASAAEVQGLLRAAQVADLFHAVTSSGDVEASKPDPDIVLAALARLRLEPHEAVMIGDTPYDVEAARRSAVPILALRCGGGWSDAELSGAAAIYDGPSDLLARIDRSILGPRVDVAARA